VAPLLLRFLQGRTAQIRQHGQPCGWEVVCLLCGTAACKPMGLQHASQESCVVLVQVRDIQEICPGVGEQEAIKALEMCSSR
jgi:hypothetical protein